MTDLETLIARAEEKKKQALADIELLLELNTKARKDIVALRTSQSADYDALLAELKDLRP